MSFLPRTAISACHPDAGLPAQTIVQFVGPFDSRYRTLPADFHHRFAAQEVP